MNSPAIPSGTRDFSPEEVIKRRYIFDTIRSIFEKYGFSPIETPTMENLSVLTGKYGDEGDQLIYKVLNTGDYLSKVSSDDLDKGIKNITQKISEKGLRYDLTVPFSRYVVMHQNEISFPFKRYQIQPVWRADRPQKGRYREFYQCDVDVIGTKSLICEAEVVMIINDVFEQLGIIDYEIKINNRKILTAMAAMAGASGEGFGNFFVTIDKLDKIGEEKVIKELSNKGFGDKAVEIFQSFKRVSNADNVLEELDKLLDDDIGNEGLGELRKVISYLKTSGANMNSLNVDLMLARGLSYYTGTIFEVKVKNVGIGSVGGGGRYDNLTSLFGLDGMSGIGFSFGVDRLYDVLEILDIFPEEQAKSTQVMITCFDEPSQSMGLQVLKQLRNQDIKAEIYPDIVKFKKQMSYTNKRGIPYVIIIGDEEIRENKVVLKDMVSGEQNKLSVEEVISQLKAS